MTNRLRSNSALLTLLCLAASLTACSSVDRVVTGSTIPDDLRQRHPIVLANAPQTLDIFLSRDGKIDSRQTRDLKAFAELYRSRGQGVISVLVPRGPGIDQSARATLAAVRTQLSHNGLTGYINVGDYPIANAALASPVRLSFASLQAQLATRCGEWPADLASGSSAKGLENRPYYNLGCAYQQNFAAQIDDPRDLVRPRTEDPSDVQLRTRAIGFIRRGEDPSTFYRFNNPKIGEVGQ